MRRALPVAISLLLAACASVPPSEDRAGAPARFASIAEVEAYVGRFFAGGQIDELTIGRHRYLVVIQHGSGIPILGYAQIYRRTGNRWTWIAKASIPRFAFPKIVALDGKIVALADQPDATTLLYDPKARGGGSPADDADRRGFSPIREHRRIPRETWV